MDLSTGKIKYWTLAAVLIVAGAVGIYFFTQPAVVPESTAEAGLFSLVIDYGDSSSVYEDISFEAGETLFLATQRLADANGLAFEYGDYGDMGMLITGLGSRRSGEGGAYWQYWVNGLYAQVGASAYQLQNGDRIEWKLTDAQQ